MFGSMSHSELEQDRRKELMSTDLGSLMSPLAHILPRALTTRHGSQSLPYKKDVFCNLLYLSSVVSCRVVPVHVALVLWLPTGLLFQCCQLS